jgi:hypothetical protein
MHFDSDATEASVILRDCYSFLDPSDSIFSHASAHCTLRLGRKTKLCALGSDSICSEHFVHVKS